MLESLAILTNEQTSDRLTIMKKFNIGLQDHQAVRLDGGLLIKLSPYNKKYQINGEPITVPQAEILISDTDTVEEVISLPRGISRYIDQAGETVDPTVVEHYRTIINQLTEDTEQLDDLSTEQLEKYILAKKELSKFKPIYDDPSPTTKPVTFTIVGSLLPTGSDFISSPIRNGQFKSPNIYSVDAGLIAHDQLKKTIDEHYQGDVNYPTHSNLEFFKLDSKYVFTDDAEIRAKPWCKNIEAKTLTTSLKEAHSIEAEIRKSVHDRLMLFIKPKPIDQILALDLIKGLENMKKSAWSLKVNKSSIDDHRALQRKINELHKKLITFSGVDNEG